MSTDLQPGTRVRFKRGPLGLVRLDEPTRFVDRTAAPGETGTVADEKPGPEGWVYVDVGDGLYAPEHPGALEILNDNEGETT